MHDLISRVKPRDHVAGYVAIPEQHGQCTLIVLCLLRAHTTQLCDILEVAHMFQKQPSCLAVR